MEKQENKSNWDDLAREIGAEISPDIIQREQVASSRSESDIVAAKPVESETTEHVAPPKRAATDWNSLVTGLGLPPLPPEPEPEPAPKPAPPKRVAAREEPRRERSTEQEERPAEREERQPARERQQRQDSRRERSRGRGRDEDTRSRREEREPRDVEEGARSRRSEREPREGEEESRERPERGGRGRRGRGGQRRSPRERDPRGERAGREDRVERGGREGSDERIDVEIEESVTREEPRDWNDTREIRASRAEEEPVRSEERVVEPPRRSEPVREEPLKSAAISLWHKIFGTPAEQEAKLTEERVEVPETVAPLDFRDEPTDAGGFVDVQADEKPADDFAVEAERGEEQGATTEDESDERRRGRSRRRRGRGRGRRPESAEAGDAANESVRERGRRSATSDGRRRRRDEDDDDVESLEDQISEEGTGDDGEEELVGVGESRRSALQRAIPSWEEAISFIVDANMQNRSQRKPSRPGSRENGGGGNCGGGGGRGRSRGRRKPQ